MQIFATSPCPTESAKALDNIRVSKMCVESAQILSGAMILNGHRPPYKSRRWLYHPCVKWSAKSSANFVWLYRHYLALTTEYNHRFQKYHKCRELKYTFENFIFNTSYTENSVFITPFPNCTIFKNLGLNIHSVYKLYLCYKWLNGKMQPRWTNRNPPIWFQKYVH